jgi:type III pantothenate kinase
MTTLLLDVGNTRVKWGHVRNGRYAFSGSLPLSSLSVEQFLQQIVTDDTKPSKVILSAVSDADWVKMLRFQLTHVWACRLIEVVSEVEREGLRNGYEQAHRLGTDRWCALLGAWRLQTDAVCVVDAGTALTMDVVNNGGVHLGGLIVPGLTMMRQCLIQGTARLGQALDVDEQQLEAPKGLLGCNTAQAVAGGSLWSLAASVERLRAQAVDLVGGDMRCIITGGDAQQLLPLLSGEWQWMPDLVLKGLLAYTDEASIIV